MIVSSPNVSAHSSSDGVLARRRRSLLEEMLPPTATIGDQKLSQA
ncbi:hypothetical protein [Nostoc sp. XA010]|nr:hypothetical protein [Nostoc sp. XA010]